MARKAMAHQGKDIAEEAREEEREASTPGARGHEYRDKERMGDEGPAFKRGGGMKPAPHEEHKADRKHGMMKRERGGYLPEETEREEKQRGQRGKEQSHEAEAKPDREEGEEKYADEAAGRKHGGKVKRARGGHIPEHKMAEKMLKHHPRKRGGKVPGKAAKSRPDRRARGGATADLNPMSAAGNMSVPDYEKQHRIPNGGGIGVDNRGDRRLD